MKSNIKDFTDLIVWQKGHSLCIEVYRTTKSYPKEEVYSLTSQTRRSASSITANIAEGFGRTTSKDQERFYVQANGSLLELRNHLLLARDIEYIDFDTWESLNNNAIEVHRLLTGLIKAHRSRG